MVDGTFVDSLAQELRKPWKTEIGGQALILAPDGSGGFKDVPVGPQPLPEPHPLQIESLVGLVSYLESDIDGVVEDTVCVHVTHHDHVEVVSGVKGEFQQRFTHLVAQAAPPKFAFGHFLAIEEFVIGLQATFVDVGDRAKVLRVVGSIREEKVKQIQDDGVSQGVTARDGVAYLEDVPVPNPVTLAPYRTFVEVDQPASSFILRLRSGREGGLPSCALFEADGGRWRLDAMDRVKAYLEERLKAADLESIPIIA